jgi:hypothetical protein
MNENETLNLFCISDFSQAICFDRNRMEQFSRELWKRGNNKYCFNQSQFHWITPVKFSTWAILSKQHPMEQFWMKIRIAKLFKMSKNPFSKFYFLFGVIAALVYGIPAFVFIQKANYTESWVLYIGNFLFMIVIAFFLFYISRFKDIHSSTLSLIVDGEKTVLTGIVASALLSFILLLILVHGLLGTGTPGKVMTEKPANTITDRTNGLDFMLIMNSLIGNFVTGSFVSVMLAASLKRKNKTEIHQLKGK